MKVTKTRWIDTNKGDDRNPVYRSRPVGKEFNKEAMEAYWKEWKKLEDKKTWQWSTLAEWSDVVENAKNDKYDGWGGECHFGYLFGLAKISTFFSSAHIVGQSSKIPFDSFLISFLSLVST